MDHALRTISYIADIGDILVIMARRGPVAQPPGPDGQPVRHKRQAKVICHVFETDEVGKICLYIKIIYIKYPLQGNSVKGKFVYYYA